MSYIYTFYKNLNVRRSCAKCPYTNLKRVSDITLADFWGWQESVPNMNKDNKGISLVLSNTKKGEELFRAISNNLDYQEVPLDKIMQPQLISPVPKDSRRDEFEEYYINHGFVATMKKYGDISFSYNFRMRLKFLLSIPWRIFHKLKRF